MEKAPNNDEGLANQTKQTFNHETVNEKPFIPLSNFKIKLKEEIGPEDKPLTLDGVNLESAKELSEGLGALYDKSLAIFKKYQQEEIWSKGNRFHDTESPISGYPDRIRRYIYSQNSGVTFGDLHGDIKVKERFYESISEAFELFACIKYLKPGSIVALVNGASRMGAICEAMGFKVNKLSIHKKAGLEAEKGSYRHELSNEIDYTGDEIKQGSKVLLLEDTSSLEEERTYRDARKWLSDRGVIDAPVFMQRMVSFSSELYGQQPSVDELIDIQKHLDSEQCFLSLSIFKPSKNSDYWKRTKGKLTKVIEERPELYSDFFSLIRELGHEQDIINTPQT